MRYALVLWLLTVVPSWGQTNATGKAETQGPCSPAVTGSNNQFTINCQGISKEQGAEFLKILNKISHYCPAKISEGRPNPFKISMIMHGRSENDLN